VATSPRRPWMSEDNRQTNVEEIPFSEAVELVGSKPGGSERKDLITYWGFGKKNWRWCLDIKMTLDEAIKTHQTIGDGIKVVVGKKGDAERAREKEEKKRREEMSKEEKQHEKEEKEEKEQTRRREKEEKEQEKERKREEERKLKETKKDEKERKKRGEAKKGAEDSPADGSPPAATA